MQDELVDFEANLKFTSAKHKEAHEQAKVLLDQEIDRQKEDADRLMAEWRGLPDSDLAERIQALREEFALRRDPYVNLLVKLRSTAMPVFLKPLGE